MIHVNMGKQILDLLDGIIVFFNSKKKYYAFRMSSLTRSGTFFLQSLRIPLCDNSVASLNNYWLYLSYIFIRSQFFST